MAVRKRSAIAFQSAYYIVTGAAPLLSRRAFEALTGRKCDWWLVQMVGLLAVANGAALGAGLRAVVLSPETRTLSVLSALAFAGIDVAYALRGRISKIYLLDALVEAAIAAFVEWPGQDDDASA